MRALLRSTSLLVESSQCAVLLNLQSVCHIVGGSHFAVASLLVDAMDSQTAHTPPPPLLCCRSAFCLCFPSVVFAGPVRALLSDVPFLKVRVSFVCVHAECGVVCGMIFILLSLEVAMHLDDENLPLTFFDRPTPPHPLSPQLVDSFLLRLTSFLLCRLLHAVDTFASTFVALYVDVPVLSFCFGRNSGEDENSFQLSCKFGARSI